MADVIEETVLGVHRQAGERLLTRVRGLSDEEYFWEPAAGCWSVRRAADDAFRCEWQYQPELPGPFTTIAARMWHLGARPWDLPILTRDLVIEMQFVKPYCPDGSHPLDACGTADEAINSLERNLAVWIEHYKTLSDEELHTPMGRIARQYSHDSYFGLLVHFIDEYVHHSAEIAVMRDLYQLLESR